MVTIEVKKGQVYSCKNSNGHYEIIQVIKILGNIENIRMRNVNNKSDEGFDVSEYEFERDYKLL